MKTIERIYLELLQLESRCDSAEISVATKNEILGTLNRLATELDSQIHLLTPTDSSSAQTDWMQFRQRLPAWLKGALTREHLGNILRALERTLQKSPRDHDFLITEGDTIDKESQKLPLSFYLENLQSAFNVGSIFRTADFLGAERLVLGGYTPGPAWPQVQKTAMGANLYVQSDRLTDQGRSLAELRQNSGNIRWVAIETSENALNYTDAYILQPTLFLVGNERYGLSAEALSLADEIRCIHGRGVKNSLNVGVALALVAGEWQRQWLQQ